MSVDEVFTAVFDMSVASVRSEAVRSGHFGNSTVSVESALMSATLTRGGITASAYAASITSLDTISAATSSPAEPAAAVTSFAI